MVYTITEYIPIDPVLFYHTSVPVALLLRATSLTCISEILHFIQLEFIQQAKKSCKVEGIWYNQDLLFNSMNLCLQSSVDWITAIASYGDKPFCDDIDPHVYNCVRFHFM